MHASVGLDPVLTSMSRVTRRSQHHYSREQSVLPSMPSDVGYCQKNNIVRLVFMRNDRTESDWNRESGVGRRLGFAGRIDIGHRAAIPLATSIFGSFGFSGARGQGWRLEVLLRLDSYRDLNRG